MPNQLTDAEIKSILEKIRSEYRENAKLNPKSFDLAGFEKRYLQILQMKGNITQFLNEEVLFLEQIKTKIKQIAEKKEIQKAETLNKIMDDNLERLSAYPKIDFHALAKPEMRYFYGAMVDFCEKEVPTLMYIFKGTPEYSQIQDPIMAIERAGLTRKGIPPVRIQDLIRQLMDSNGNMSQMERATQNLLKDTCISLKGLIVALERIQKDKRILPDKLIQLQEKLDPNAYREYQAKPFGETLQKILEKTKKIIRDFRMNAIVGLEEWTLERK